MLGFGVGKVFFDALILCLLLYVVARQEADYSFQKVAMVVAGTALGNLLILVSAREHLSPVSQVWVLPLIEVGFSAFMIMTFCWISFWKSILVVTLFSVMHIGFGLAMGHLIRKALGSAEPAPAATVQSAPAAPEIKQESVPVARPGKDRRGQPPARTNRAAAGNPPAGPSPAAGWAGSAPSATPAARQPAGRTPAAGRGKGDSVGPVDWEAVRQQIEISGIGGRPGAYTALVNHRPVAPGDVVSVLYQGKTYRWTVREITEREVRLEPRMSDRPE